MRHGDTFCRTLQRSGRTRLYPRHLDVLRKLSEPEARLIRNPVDGRYRLNSGDGRSATVILRTLRTLLRSQTVRQVGGEQDKLVITEAGRRVVRRYQHTVVDLKARRLLKMGIRKFEKRVQVRAVVFDGSNIADIDELVGPELYQLRFNRIDNRVDVIMGNGGHVFDLGALKPNEHIVVMDSDDVLSVRSIGDFKNEFRELKAA